MNGCVQENLVHDWKDTVGKISDANGLDPGPLDQAGQRLTF